MPMNAAVIFPGQGSQSVGMGKDVVESSQKARAIYDRANDILGFDIARLCFEGPPGKLEQTDIQQPAIFTASVAIWEAFIEAGGKRDYFKWSAGLSLGEYTALYAAGALEFDDALRLVRRRGELMQEAALANPSGMVSLIGADEATARSLCERAREDEVLAPANFNCPGQIVISGSRGACDRALALAPEFGCRGVALAVAGAFHSTLMERAANGLRPVLSETGFKTPQMTVLANVSADRHTDPAGIRESLCRQITQPVLWQTCMERMIREGVQLFCEIGPGRVLTGLVRKIDRKAPVVNVSGTEGIEGAVAALAAGGVVF